MRPLIYVLVGVLLGLTALAILFWVLASAQDDHIVEHDTPGPDRYLPVGVRVDVNAARKP
ncbi:hypothetical protein [Nonomuraea cavernae]|uniref:Uncharacterized protein n=1 Tax=Nonomuraea cavernae TaxID=2045107 RepID=A0A918DEY0_9ACTN|nr:hypothetical protein [Nonomuraea cavernae]MCA2184681.1 hypothetical protein [Nonomuraea cavernae]GGO63079.1 hypothetical protein GCM10012289_09160 [Nonomuraea cavernae]